MILIQLQGGLGNQMFQYAAAKALAVRNKCSLLLDLSFLEETATQERDGFTTRHYGLGIFDNVSQRFVSHSTRKQFTEGLQQTQWLKRLGFSYPKIYREASYEFNEHLFKQKPPVLLEGYWQSERYFIMEAAEIRKAFRFPELVASDQNNAVRASISTHYPSIAVHVRRADYLHPAIAAQHGTCSEAYYKAAIQFMLSSFPSAILFFFSDDAAWVKTVFTDHLPNSVLVKNNNGPNSWKDMYLMSKCSHHIIANSSFSWWGAWLNDQPGKTVIAPKTWFADPERNAATGDLIPENWVRL